MIFSSKFIYFDHLNSDGDSFFGSPRNPRKSLKFEEGQLLEATRCDDGVWRCLEVERAQRENVTRLINE